MANPSPINQPSAPRPEWETGLWSRFRAGEPGLWFLGFINSNEHTRKVRHRPIEKSLADQGPLVRLSRTCVTTTFGGRPGRARSVCPRHGLGRFSLGVAASARWFSASSWPARLCRQRRREKIRRFQRTRLRMVHPRRTARALGKRPRAFTVSPATFFRSRTSWTKKPGRIKPCGG